MCVRHARRLEDIRVGGVPSDCPLTRYTMIVPTRASGYHRDGGALHVAPTRTSAGPIVGHGPVHDGDLLVWQQNFADLRVGDPALIAAMQAPTVLAGGDTTPGTMRR